MRDDEDTDAQGSRGQSTAGGSGSQKRRSFEFLDHDDYKGNKSPLVGKFLRDHIERLDEDIAELKPYRERYFDTKSRLDVLVERKGLTRLATSLTSVMLAVGGVGIGVAKDLSDGENGLAGIVAACSILLIVCSFLIRVRDV